MVGVLVASSVSLCTLQIYEAQPVKWGGVFPIISSFVCFWLQCVPIPIFLFTSTPFVGSFFFFLFFLVFAISHCSQRPMPHEWFSTPPQAVKGEVGLLLQKIKSYNAALRDTEGIYIVRPGLPAVHPDELKKILEERETTKELERKQRMEDALSRSRALYSSTLEADRPNEPICQHSFIDPVPLADIDGKAALLATLKSLFRITLIRCRVQDRLNRIKESEAEMIAEKASPRAPSALMIRTVAHLPQCAMEKEELRLPQCDEAFRDIDNEFTPVHNFEVFEKREFRVPFRFKTKNYVPAHFPEFSLDLTDEAKKEVDIFHIAPQDNTSMPTLRNFTQPIVTLERYQMPNHAYHLLPASRYGAFEKTGNDHLAPKVFVPPSKAADPIRECAASSAIQVCTGLSALPQKLVSGRPEDSLSDSESEDGAAPRDFQTNVDWVPKMTHTAKSTPPPVVDDSSVNASSFTRFLEKFM